MKQNKYAMRFNNAENNNASNGEVNNNESAQNEQPKPSFLQKHGKKMVIGASVAAVATGLYFIGKKVIAGIKKNKAEQPQDPDFEPVGEQQK